MPAYPHMPDPRRVTAIYGGTFDPVHLGHVNVLQQLVATGHVEQGVFMPAAQNPLKRGQQPTAARHRLAMLERVVAAEPDLYVSDWEIRRRGLSYSIDTAQHYAATYGDRLRLVIGADSLETLHLWVAARQLVGDFRLLIYRRPGAAIPDTATLRARWGADLAARIEAAVVTGPELDISATAIRRGVAEGKDVSALLMGGVSRYIVEESLYRRHP